MFNQVRYINLSEIVHVLKAVPIVTRVHLNILMIFVVSHFLSAKMSPQWRLNPSFGTKKKCPSAPEQWCPFNRGPNLCSLNGGVPLIKVFKGRGSSVYMSSIRIFFEPTKQRFFILNGLVRMYSWHFFVCKCFNILEPLCSS